ncbi:MAG: NTP transferase domain-containing protein [Deltaproteobacteria bacterium]|nr:NTP transferase domain-containing protein [Deltaproteobacteria bacterium]
MGRPKALLPWRGVTLVETVTNVLRQAVDEVVVVTSGEFALPHLNATVVRDREPRLGPLGGIRDGLHAIRSDLAFVASTDAPFLSASFVRAMLAFGRPAACDVDGHVQTLCAVYERGHAELSDSLIRQGRMRPLFLLEHSGFRRVSADEVPDVKSIRGFNTPAAYLAALGEAPDARTATLEFVGNARQRTGASRIDVPVGTLGDILRRHGPDDIVQEDGEIGSHYLVSLNGCDFVRDPGIPIGPGDCVILMDRAVGG